MVGFNGNFYLRTTKMDKYFKDDFGYTCGILSYSFRATVKQDAAILHIFLAKPSTKITDFSTLRLEHNLGPDIGGDSALRGGLSLFLQDAWRGQNSSDPDFFSFLVHVSKNAFERFYDGEWHTVLINWDLSLFVPTVEITIDTIPQIVDLGFYVPSTSGNRSLKFAGTNSFSIFGLPPDLGFPGNIGRGLVSWGIGVDLTGVDREHQGSSPYVGDLDRLSLRVTNTSTIGKTRTNDVCNSLLLFRQEPQKDVKKDEPPIVRAYTVPGWCLTPPPRDKNGSLTSPEYPQLFLSGSPAEFQRNYGAAKLGDPFGFSQLFLKTGTATEATHENKGAVDLSLGASLSNTNSNTPAPALATQPPPDQLTPGVYAQPITQSGLAAPPAPLGGVTVPPPLGQQKPLSADVYFTGPPPQQAQPPVNNATANFTPTTETPTETFTVHGNLTQKDDGPPKWDKPRAITIVRTPKWTPDEAFKKQVLMANIKDAPIPLSTPIAPAGLVSFWYRTKIPALPVPDFGWGQTGCSLFSAWVIDDKADDVGIFKCALPFKGPFPKKGGTDLFNPFQQFSLTLTKGLTGRYTRYFMVTDPSYHLPADTEWHHVIAGWNLGGEIGLDKPLPSGVKAQYTMQVRFWCAVDGVQVPLLSSVEDGGKETAETFSVPWGEANSYELGMDHQNGLPYYGDLAEFYLWIGSEYIDFGTQIISCFMKNRRAVELLNDGSGPLGVKPLIYLSGDTKTFFNSPGPNGPLIFKLDTDPTTVANLTRHGDHSTDIVTNAFDDPFLPPSHFDPGGPSFFPSTMFDGSTDIELIFRGLPF